MAERPPLAATGRPVGVLAGLGWRLVAAGAAAILLGALLGWPPPSVVWHAWNLLAAALLFGAGRRLGTRALWSATFVTLVSLLGAVTILDGSGAVRPFGGSGERVSLFLANPDLLASTLVALGGAAIATSGKRTTVALTPLLVVAMTYTGSRTGLLALAALFIAWVVAARPRAATRATLLAVVVFIGALLVTTVPAVTGQNLLRFSWDLTHGVWRHDAQGISITPLGSGGQRGDLAFRVEADPDERSAYPSIALYQPVERSRPGVPYVASAELRSDEPQRVAISSNLATTSCDVTGTWTRCATPAASGNGRTYVQLQLRHHDEHALDVEVRRAQVEVGRVATAYQPTDVDPWTVYVPRRLDPRTWLRQWPDSTRVAIYEKAVALIRAEPWTGHGVGAFAAAARGDRSVAFADPSTAHAHSTPLQLGVEFGLLGVLLWAVVLTAMARSAVEASRHRGIALVVAIATLALLDATLFTSTVYPVVFVSAGVLSRPSSGVDASSKSAQATTIQNVP